MQATEPFYELILRCDQEVCFERVSGFELENTTFSKIKLSMGGQKKVSVSANANSPLPVSALGNSAPKIF